MYKLSIKIFLPLLLVMAVSFSSCFNDLDTEPIDPDTATAASVYTDANAYKQVLAKIYAILAVSGQQGPAGQPDIAGIDEGFSNYLRQYWKAQELTTDEAIIAWNDGNLQDYHQQDWNAANEFVTATYNRIFYLVSIANEFIREASDDKLSERGINNPEVVRLYRAEARFMRALAYWHALDMFRGNVPFVTEADAVGAFFPDQTNATDLFNYIESELKAIEGELATPTSNDYARADQAAAWMLLSKLYLNASVYGQGDRNTDCVTYCNKIIGSGYTLHPSYQELFLADNHTASGVIFPVAFDGAYTKTYGGTTFLIHAAVGGSMAPTDFGIDGGWGGTRTTSALVNKFPSIGGGEPLVIPTDGNTASYPVIYVPGGHQGWDPATAPTLRSVNSDDAYEGYLYLDAGTEFKFTPNPDWSADFSDGGSGVLSTSGGGNFMVADAGFYKLNVDVANLTYAIESTTWGIIGSATAGGWDSDTDMTYDAAEGAWVATIDLIGGGGEEIKFRANDDWAINYGDTGTDAVLDNGGDNIAIPSGGTYIIKLYLDQPDYTYGVELVSFDSRAMFYTDGQSLEITERGDFNQGYGVTKFKNIDKNGNVGSDITFPDTDFPMFRLADVHLMYAEAVVRGGAGGDVATAVSLVNQVLERAYDGAGGNIQEADLSLDFILDERARELYWEGHRRTDLIRFGKFSNTDYLWPLKGGVVEGRAVDQCYDVFPVPSADLGANPNLEQYLEGGCY